jgi:hypothetical protein
MAAMSFNEKQDSRDVNDVLNIIQQKGGKILDVKVSLGLGNIGSNRAITTCLITYEAPTAIEIG